LKILALDNNGKITETGNLMADFPISPYLAKVLLASIKYKCSAEMIIIVSMLSVEDVYISPRGQKKQEEAHKAHSYFHHVSGDHMTMLNIYKQWASPSLGQYSKEWCKQYFLHYRALVMAKNIKGQLELIFQRLNLPIISCRTKGNALDNNENSGSSRSGSRSHGHKHKHHHRHHSSDHSSNERVEEREDEPYDNTMKDYDYSLILKSVCQAYYMNVAKRFTNRPYFYNYKQSTSDTLIKMFGKDQQQELVPLFIHPSSSIHSSSHSQDAHYLEWVIYHHTMFTNRCYIRHVSIINFEWVKDLLNSIDKVDYSKLLEKDVHSIVREERQLEEVNNSDDDEYDKDDLSVHDENEKEDSISHTKKRKMKLDAQDHLNQEITKKKQKSKDNDKKEVEEEEDRSQQSVEDSRKAALQRYLQRKQQKEKKKKK